MSTDNLSPPGSGVYDSNDMYVGDGTWDEDRNSFLLPNLVGLNFDTMRYNGMGNRFEGLPQYHRLILGHAVLAAIVFLGIVPTAIFLAKFGKRWPGPRRAFKLHVYLQILTVILVTVVFALGWFAVGPERSLTNPHHGIGLAIYIMILFQFIYATIMYKRERKRKVIPTMTPLPVWLHMLLGRTIGILAIVQIALGLTLYGSPRVLFILYALAGFFIVVAYLTLTYREKRALAPGGPHGHGHGQQSEFYSDYGSYLSGSRTDMTPGPRHEKEEKDHHWGRKILAGGGALGAYKWWKHRKEGKEDERDLDERESRERLSPRAGTSRGATPTGRAPPGASTMTPSRPRSRSRSRDGRPMSESRLTADTWEKDETSEPEKSAGWKDKILGAAGGIAAFQGVKSLFNRKKRRDDDYDRDTRYGSTLGGNRNMVSQTDISRVEDGRAPMSPDTPRNQNLGGNRPMSPSQTPSRPSRHPRFTDNESSYLSQDSYPERSPPRNRDSGGNTLRDSIATLGAIGGFKEWNRQRKERNEAQRADKIRRQELDRDDSYNRRNSGRYPTAGDNQRRPSMTETMMTGDTGYDRDHGFTPSHTNLSRTQFSRPDTSQPPLPANAGTMASTTSRGNDNYTLPPPPPGPPPPGAHSDFASAHMPKGAVNPDPSRLLSSNTARNESSAYGRDNTPIPPPVPSHTSPSPTRHNRPNTSASAAAPSTSSHPADAAVSLQMHNDGHHVTLRRLSDQEAAAERAARRTDRRTNRRTRRTSSVSSGAGPGAGDTSAAAAGASPRYRRGSKSNARVRPSSQQPYASVPVPPPASSGVGSSATGAPTQPTQKPSSFPPPAPSSNTNAAGAARRRSSELNLPPSATSPAQHLSPPGPQPAQGFNDSVGSPGAYGTDGGTGTDVSAFADNRRRRRAERARKAEEAAAARGGAGRGGGRGVEFE